MTRFPQSIASLFLLLVIVAMPAVLPGCGGDRYNCDDCGEGQQDNPDENDSEDPAEILPLSFIEAAEFSVIDLTDVDNFDNYSDIDYRINTITEATATEYDEDDTLANIAGISAERWDDQIETLSWGEAISDIDDGKQRQYYRLTDAGWELKTGNNKHELRRYDDKVYDFWLDVTIKWEIYEAKDRVNSDNVSYPSIAGKNMDKILLDEAFKPPILNNEIVLQSSLLWGENVIFSDVTDAEAKIFVVYKQFRPITLEGDTDTAVDTEGFIAFVPAPANENGTAFVFQPVSSTTNPDQFILDRTGREDRDRFKINTRLYASFNPDGTPGTGGEGVILWGSQQTQFEDGVADYEEVTTTNGSYIVINLAADQKIYYGLETYENPLIAFVEEDENEGINNGAHIGWYYKPSGTLDTDKPQPHYAFNGPAVSDLKNAFSAWRKLKYCEDNDHDVDPGKATVCAGISN
jgi:hypothetical protein